MTAINFAGPTPMPAHSPTPALQLRGYAFGLLGVLAFSITLPATRVAVASFDPFFVGLGRELVAAFLAAPLLYFTEFTSTEPVLEEPAPVASFKSFRGSQNFAPAHATAH